MNYVSITEPDINNGNGIRATIWFAGCSHHCKGCHNEWLQNYHLGKDISILYEEIVTLFNKKTYLDGITLSGGDPLAQNINSLVELYEFIEWFKNTFPSKNIWIFTGYVLEHLIDSNNNDDKLRLKIISLCDYLVDGPFIEELKDLSLPFRGSSNQRIIDVDLNKFHWNIE